MSLILGLAIGGAVLIVVITVTVILCRKAHETKIEHDKDELDRERGVEDWGTVS